MTELALAAFAAATGGHVVGERPGFACFQRRFDAAAYEARLAELGVRFVARSDPAFPALLRAIHDPPPGLFVGGEARVELLARTAVAIVGARARARRTARASRARWAATSPPRDSSS